MSIKEFHYFHPTVTAVSYTYCKQDQDQDADADKEHGQQNAFIEVLMYFKYNYLCFTRIFILIHSKKQIIT